MSQPGSFATLILEGAPAIEDGRPGSFDGIRVMAEALKSLFRNDGAGGGDPSAELGVHSIGFVPSLRIEILVPSTAVGFVGSAIDAVGSCLDAAFDGNEPEQTEADIRMAGVLGAMLGAGGWNGVRIALREDGWETRVVVVPAGIAPALARLAARRSPGD